MEGETASPSSSDESLMENRPSHSRSNCKAPSRNARRKKMKRQRWAEAKKEMGEAPSRNGRRRKREIWAKAKKEFREMKKDKLLEKIKKLEDCVWLLEKDGEDMAEIKKVRSLLKSTQKQYEENEELLAQAGSSASQQLLNSDRLEKMPVETMAAPVEKVEADEQNMGSGEAEGGSLEGCKAVPEQSELAEEANRLKSEIETVRQDHDYQLAQAQSLMADVAKQKEVARMYGVELEDAMRRVAALEDESLLQNETIRTLQVQLASTNEKLTVRSPTRD
uniref:Uncharacterized protein n=1 Tax=Avena sativa TaxID=4498 RepID=A0ACD6ABL3_AVESA